MSYIDPYISDDELIGSDSCLYRKQSRKDFQDAEVNDPILADLWTKERTEVADGFRRIPGASRSGALDPQTKARMRRQEADGLVELQRDVHGELVGYREVNH